MENKKPNIKLSWFDRAVMAISPVAGMKRIRAKATVSSLEATGYITPGKNRRSVRGWLPGAGTADEDSIPSLKDLRAGSRDLSMNAPLARGALKRVRTNTVGSGLVLQSRIDYKYLQLTEEKANEWEQNTEREFTLWSESTHCDLSRDQNFYELQGSVVYNTMLSGDVFSILAFKRYHDFPYGLKIKLVEADRCSNSDDRLDGLLENGNTLIGGIERDENGAPVRYHFEKKVYNSFVNAWASVDAFSPSGRQNVLHLMDKERPGQSRGIPLLAPVMETLKQLARYSEAELMSTIIASFFTVFVKTSSPQFNGFQDGFVPPSNQLEQGDGAGVDSTVDEKSYEIGAGTINYMDTDESIELANPTRPNPQFEPFFLAYVKQIGSALELPFEELILHFSSSYSASRAALLQAWKFYRTHRSWLVNKFCNPVYQLWLEEAVAIGRIDAPGFFDDVAIRMAWAGSDWDGPGMGQIDPKRETEAAQLRIDGYLSTREQEHISIYGGGGGRFEGTVNRSVREQKLIQDEKKSMGILETSEPGQETKKDEPNLDDLEDQR